MRGAQPLDRLPAPDGHRHLGHLPRWGAAPLELLQDGARLGRLFTLRLGTRAVVGYSPHWNRALLTDLDAFGSAGSFSRAVPHLAGGIILTDAPQHGARRAQMNPPFSARAMGALRARVQEAAWAHAPRGEFDALAWADRVTLAMLNAAYFSGEFPPRLLHAFLAPLRRPFPAPLRPLPLLFARVDAQLGWLAKRRLEDPGEDDLLAHLARLPGGLREARVSLAAGHDTTTHTLAWAAWHLARHARWRTEDGLRPVVRETLRLYPPGWVGSRKLRQDVQFEGLRLPRGTLALYSPLLSARDPEVWEAPGQFMPERFEQKPPAWSYLPFGGGERTCLGMHLAQLLLHEALCTLLHGELRMVWGDPTPRPGVTLGPAGPLMLRRT